MRQLTRLEITLALLAFILFITLLDAIETIWELEAGLPVTSEREKVTVINGECKSLNVEK